MAVPTSNEAEVILGIFDLTFLVVSFVLGLKILLRYRKHHETALITVGLAWIFTSLSYLGGATSFISRLLTARALDVAVWVLISYATIPVTLLFWVYSFFLLFHPRHVKIAVPIYALIGVAYEVVFFVFYFSDLSLLGGLTAEFFFHPGAFTFGALVFFFANVLVTVIFYVWESFKTSNPKTKLKGGFLLLAFLSLVTSLLIEISGPLDTPSLIICRAIAISSAFEYYLSFLMPDSVARLFIKNFNQKPPNTQEEKPERQ